MSMKRIGSLVMALWQPPVCRGCGERQSIFAPTLPQVLCPRCATRWATRMKAICPRCGKAYVQCSCMPVALSEAGVRNAVKLSTYRADTKELTERLVLRCKDVNDRALLEFLAADLTLPTFRAWQALEVAAESSVTCFVPRRPQAVREIGHDQARELARALARRMDLACKGLLRHAAHGRQQKALDAEQRRENAACSYRLAKGARVKGKTVLLVDDICTTGASLAACAKLLYDAGADHVVAVCVAVSEQRQTDD